MPRLRHAIAIVGTLSATLSLGGCLLAAPDEEAAGSGPELAVVVTALELASAGDVVWDVAVFSGSEEPVWQRRLTSSAFGDGAGSTTYVGPCDARPEAEHHTVDLWLVGVFAQPIPPGGAGAFNAGSAIGDGAVDGTALPVQSPTASGPIRESVTCLASEDVAVTFDVTVLRPASQGFFDVAIGYDELFCSAKFDCCYDIDGEGCAADGADDILLLHDAGGARGRTFILALSCTAGPGGDALTTLLMDSLELDCTTPAGAPFTPDVTIDPGSHRVGNLCDASAIAACEAISAPVLDPSELLFQVATFRGVDALVWGTDVARVAYWNVALGVEPAITGCRLRSRATAADAERSPALAATGLIPDGHVYPYIAWEVDLAACGAEALALGDPDATVGVAYSGLSGGPVAFAARFAPDAAVFVGPAFEDLELIQGTPLPSLDSAHRFVDPRDGTLSFSLVGDAPPGLAIDPGAGTLTGTPTTPGTFVVQVAARGAHPAPTPSNAFTVVVTPGAPSFVGPNIATLAAQQHAPLAPFDAAARFEDPAGGALTYSLSGTAPTGVTIHPTSGVISGTPTQAGTFNLQVIASGAEPPPAASNTFALVVASAAPSFVGPSVGTISGNQNQTLTSVATASRFSDPGGLPLTYSFVGSPPTGVTIHSATGLISGTPTASGSFSVRVRATNGHGLSADSNQFSISIAAAPTGQTSFTTVGNFTFTVPAGVTSISAVAVGGGGRGGLNGINFVSATESHLRRGSTNFIRAGPGGNGGVGSSPGWAGSGSGLSGAVIHSGGVGGDSGNNRGPGGGGGAAGYSGSGGAGGAGRTSSGTTHYGQVGSGGGGGGGSGSFTPGTHRGGSGGGVGILGIGSNGGRSTASGGHGGGGSGGTNGSNLSGGDYGGGGGGGGSSNRAGGGGGGLVYLNDIPVTPGEVLHVQVGRGASSSSDGMNVKGRDGGQGAVRIIWGPNRSFPAG